MSTFATASSPAPAPAEMAVPKLSEQDLEKLQEIHELVNILMRELPMIAQITNRSYVAPTPGVPYTYSLYQVPWGGGVPVLHRQG